jgi:methyl-accepting chemotaxis protein
MKVRQNKLILKGFEQHFILLSFMTVITALILLTALVTGMLWLIDPMLIGNATLEEAAYMGVIGVAIMAVTYYYTMRINHRVAGPVMVLMRNLDRLGEGDLTTEMRLRHHDHLKEVVESFNSNVSNLREAIRQIKNTANALKESPDPETAKKMIEQLCDDLEKLKTSD